jgi:hypothetical protein
MMRKQEVKEKKKKMKILNSLLESQRKNQKVCIQTMMMMTMNSLIVTVKKKTCLRKAWIGMNWKKKPKKKIEGKQQGDKPKNNLQIRKKWEEESEIEFDYLKIKSITGFVYLKSTYFACEFQFGK